MGLNYPMIGERIRHIRKSQKMTQVQLAEKTGLSVPYISHIETARKSVSLESLVKIADALNVTADRLLCENQECWEAAYELTELFSDCSKFEKTFLYHVAVAVKEAIRRL